MESYDEPASTTRFPRVALKLGASEASKLGKKSPCETKANYSQGYVIWDCLVGNFVIVEVWFWMALQKISNNL